MQRRQALHLLAGAALTTAGCIEQSGPSAEPTQTDARPTTAGETSSPTATPNREPTLTVETVETDEYAVRLNDLGNSPGGQIYEVSALDGRERGVTTAAIEGDYEVEDPPDWLVEFLARTRWVLDDGTYYRLKHTLPTYEITAEAVEQSAVDGEIASYETYEEAVTYDGMVTSGLMRIARRDGFEMTYVWPSLRTFLDGYDAVHYRGEVLDFSVAVDDPGPPYEVTAERTPPEDLVEEPVWNATDAAAELQRIVREAGQTRGVYSFSELPDGLFENLDAHRYVYLDGTFYTTYVEKREALPVSLTAEFTDAVLDEDGARLRLAIHNDSEEVIGVSSGAPGPFGVLRFTPSDDDSSYLLWTDAYEESNHVYTEGREITGIEDIGLTAEVQSGESVDREFTVFQQDLPAGEYVLADSVGVDVQGTGATFPYRIRFGLDR